MAKLGTLQWVEQTHGRLTEDVLQMLLALVASSKSKDH